MANNGGRRSSSAPGNNSSLILGVLIGMVVGLAVAGAVAWHLSKRPGAFTNKEQHETLAAAPAEPAQKTPVTAAPAAASGVHNAKQDYTFYHILTEDETPPHKGSGHAPAKHPSTQKEDSKPQPATASYFLQAGSFASSDDANKLKVKLALLGMESSVQTADVPGKGTYYRVRLGPYHSQDEVSKAKDALKQNGIIDAAQVRAQ